MGSQGLGETEYRFGVHNSERDLSGPPGALDFSSRVFRYGRQDRGAVVRILALYSLGLVENGAGTDRIPKRSLEIHLLSLEILGRVLINAQIAAPFEPA